MMNLNKRRMLGAGLCALLATAAMAHRANAFEVFGPGNFSCAHWRQNDSSVIDGTIWITGFFSGANAMQRTDPASTTGADTDVPGIVAEVERVCDARPSMTLSQAATEVYGEMVLRRLNQAGQGH